MDRTHYLKDLGFCIVSNRHRIAARVDRPDWREFMAREHAPWDPEGEGMDWVNRIDNPADFYRRVHSKCQIEIEDLAGWDEVFENSNHCKAGYTYSKEFDEPRSSQDAREFLKWWRDMPYFRLMGKVQRRAMFTVWRQSADNQRMRHADDKLDWTEIYT